MQDLRARADGYRSRAAEMRALAEEDKLPETRTALMKIADDYEQMSVSLDAIADSQAALRGG